MVLLAVAHGMFSLLWSVALFIDEHFALMCLGTLMVGCLGYNARTAGRDKVPTHSPRPPKLPRYAQRPAPLQPLHAHISPNAPETMPTHCAVSPREAAAYPEKAGEDGKPHRFSRLRLSRGDGEGHWSLLSQRKVKTPDSSKSTSGSGSTSPLGDLQRRLHSWSHLKSSRMDSPREVRLEHAAMCRKCSSLPPGKPSDVLAVLQASVPQLLATDPPAAAPRPSLHPPPTPAQLRLIEQFRTAIQADPRFAPRRDTRLAQAALTSERACMRFLQARGFDVATAATMFGSTMVWRAENGLDTLLDRPAPKMAAIAQLINEGFPHKCDLKGRPVMIDQVARLDAEAVLARYTVEECVAYSTHWMEFRQRFLLTTHEADGPLMDEAVTILDMAGLSRQHVSLRMFSFLQALAKVGQDYYPETVGKVVIINAGWMFSIAWRTVRQFLDAGTQRKVVVCGDGGAEELRHLVPPENLPKEFGGKCQCPGGCNGQAAWDLYFQVCERGAVALAEELGGLVALRREVQRAFGLC